ncbi:MAG TPA: PVC-type heme-binding CxxCH protein [Tepidisphaeraceae bacterium]|jgi:putative heme-binding domain-containing protein|nr:PVC-type heme-binding CxxCH protein [Tepidisphaeraceae bacterium]
MQLFRFQRAGLIALGLALVSAMCPRLPAAPTTAPAGDANSDDPEVERRMLQLPDGFDIQLFASEPLLKRPVSMTFDAQGRLWVLCIPRYPQILPGQDAIDYIAVLQDTQGKGRADQSHIFVSGLRVATGMVPDDAGGAYVGEGDLLLHFKDNTGTGKSDERQIVFSGFGTADTHHTLNTFSWGPDGFLYFDQGWYINSSIETPRGMRRRFGGAIWQFRPDSLALEIYDRSIAVNNTWGRIFDQYGQPIIASAWPADINLILPDTPLSRTDDPALVPSLKMSKLAGERHSGLEIITGRHFPADWQNNLVTGSFNSRRVQRFKVQYDADRLTVKELDPLIISHHNKFRPIDVKMGSDGALYVLDWYNIIIQHNQVNFRDPRRDHEHGRIWRITCKDRPLVPAPQLVGATIPALLDHLKDPEQWTRLKAARVLAQRDHKELLPALAQWVAAISGDKPDDEHQLLEALWLDQSIDQVEPRLLARLLHAQDARVRAAATTVFGYWHDRLPSPAAVLATQADDENMRVRLNAVLAAQRVPSAAALESALHALDHPTDSYIAFELQKAAVVLKPYWYPQFQAGEFTFGGNAKRLSFALQSVQAPDAVAQLLSLLSSGKIVRENQVDLLAAVAAMGTPPQQNIVLEAVLGADAGKAFAAPDRARLLDVLVQSARSRGVQPSADVQRVSLLIQGNDELGLAAIRAVGVWKLEPERAALEKISSDPGSTPSRRQAAVGALVDLGGPQTITYLAALAETPNLYAARVDAIAGLAQVDTQKAAGLAAELFTEPLPPGGDPSSAFTAFFRRTGGSDLLAGALKAKNPSADVARVGARQLYAAGLSAPALAEALRAGNEATDRAKRFSPAEQQRLVHLAQAQGDPGRGEKIFRGSVGCMNCHSIAGAGGNVAPDLATIGTTAQPDFLVEHLILPAKSIKDGYVALEVITRDGDSFTGIRQRESATDLVLRDATHDQIIIPKSTIKRQRSIGTLMPSGLTDALTDNELADLVRFLSELGKPGPFDVGHAPVSRQWLTLATLPPNFESLDSESLGRVLLTDAHLTWMRAYSDVAGDVPLSEFAIGRTAAAAILRCRVNITSAGKCGLLLDNNQGVQLWLDGHALPLTSIASVGFGVGLHTLDFSIDLSKRKSPSLRCELLEIPGSAAHAQWAPTR